MPQNAQAPLTLGFLAYTAGDKAAAMAEFKESAGARLGEL
jgi:hypothetical protein